MAADALIELCDNAQVPDVRRRAAEAILDRIGLRAGVEIAVTSDEVGPDASEIIHARLDALRQASAARAEILGTAQEPDVGTRRPEDGIAARP